MKDKIIAALKAKFPAVNLSKTRLDEIAARLEPKITDETQIDAQLDAFNDFNPVADIAKNDDKIRDLEIKAKKPGQQPPKKPEDTVETVETPADKDTPEWAKKLLETTTTLAQKVTALEGEKKQLTIKSKLETMLKDVPALVWAKRVMPEKEEDIEAFVREVNDDFGAYAKDLNDKGIASIPVPGGTGATGGTGGIDTKKATKEEVASVVDNIM